MNDKRKNLEILLHPEAIMDRDYQSTSYEVDDFQPLQSAFDDIKCGEMCLFAQNLENETFSVQILSERVLRLRISPDNSATGKSATEHLQLIKPECQPSDFSFYQQDGSIHAETPLLGFEYEREKHDFTFKTKNGDVLLKSMNNGIKFSSEAVEWSGNRFFAEFDFKEEAVFGLGGRTMPPCRNGQTMDFFNMKVGRRRGDYGGFSIPFFLSSKGYGLFLNNPWPHLYFDMGKTDPDKWFMLSPGGEFDLFIIYGPEFSTIMNEFTNIVGRIPIPDKSLLGFWCSSLTFVNDKQVLETVDRLHNEGYPCDIVVLDGPWRGGENFVKQYTLGHQYPSNDMHWHEDFGDGPNMIRTLKERNVMTSLHVNSRNFHPDTAREGLMKGLLRQHGDEIVVNLSEPAAVLYYESLLEPRIQEGAAIWWTDHADRVSGDLAKGLPSRNLFGSLWNRIICELMARHGIANHLCLTRGSGIGGQRYALPWPGDTLNGIEAFDADIWFAINVGLAGFPIFSADLGGFTLRKYPNDYESEEEKLAEIFDDENICRRLCQSIFFIPSPRIHNNWDSIPKLPWNCSPKAQKLYKKMLHVRYELTPYIYSYAIRAAQTGEPIIRPMVYHNRLDKMTYSLSDQFYMGDSMIVAPVTVKGAQSRKVYLPEGTWINYWTNEVFEGPLEVNCETPLFEPRGLPVFVKEGTILPCQSYGPTLRNEPPNELIFYVYPSENSENRIYEGDTVITTVNCTDHGNAFIVTFDNHTDFDRLYTFVFHSKRRPSTITCDENNIDFSCNDSTFTFQSSPRSGKKLSVTIELSNE